MCSGVCPGVWRTFSLNSPRSSSSPSWRRTEGNRVPPGSAGAHLATGLGGQLSGPGYEVIVKMCFQRIGYAHAMIGRYGSVLVDVPHRVYDGAPPRLLRAHNV